MPPGDVAPHVRELSKLLLPDADDLGARMGDRIRAEVPWYAENQVLTAAEVDRNCADNVRYILGILAGDDPTVERDAPRVTGIDRAGRGAPYAAVLAAFRVGGRFIWEILVERADPLDRELLLRSAADIWAVSDELATQVTDAYRGALADRARRDGQTRSVLVGTLLDGDGEHAEHVWETADALDLRSGTEFVVVAAQCEMPGVEPLRDIERTLRKQNVASAWRLVNDYQDGLVALRFGFDRVQLRALVAELATTRVGLSATFQRLEEAPEARRAARVASSALAPGSIGVLGYDEDPLAVLLASVPDQSADLARALLGPVLSLPTEDGQMLVETARAWLAERGSTSTAARTLHIHRNTVRYRLKRLEELTGLDLADPADMARLQVALEAVRILGLG